MTNAAQPTTFDRIMLLEDELRDREVMAALGDTFGARHAAAIRIPRARAELYAAIDALTPDQMAEFGAYRTALVR